jgi:hypothetical protein
MIDLAAAIVVSAIAMTFFSDIMSRAMKMIRPSRGRSAGVHVAHPDQSAA